MKSYKTLSEAINGLKSEGYTEDFNLTTNGLKWPSKQLELHPEDFTIDEVHRFEGMSSTDDNSVLYAISSDKKGVKGTLVDAYGVYAESLSPQMIEKLNVNHMKSTVNDEGRGKSIK